MAGISPHLSSAEGNPPLEDSCGSNFIAAAPGSPLVWSFAIPDWFAFFHSSIAVCCCFLLITVHTSGNIVGGRLVARVLVIRPIALVRAVLLLRNGLRSKFLLILTSRRVRVLNRLRIGMLDLNCPHRELRLTAFAKYLSHANDRRVPR